MCPSQPVRHGTGQPINRATTDLPHDNLAVGSAAALARHILEESSTIGVRVYPVQRYILPRAAATVKTQWGRVKVKRIERPGGAEFAPEYESCRKLAEKSGISLRRIVAAVRKG